MATKQYISGDSTLRLTGHADAIPPQTPFAHDFSIDGPEGEHGPAREAAMIAAGAITAAPESGSPIDNGEPRVRRAAARNTEGKGE